MRLSGDSSGQIHPQHPDQSAGSAGYIFRCQKCPQELACVEPSSTPLKDRLETCGIAIAVGAGAEMEPHSRPTPELTNRSGLSKVLPTRSPSSNTNRDCSRHSAPSVDPLFTPVPPTTQTIYGSDSGDSKGSWMSASQDMSGHHPKRLGTALKTRFRAIRRLSPRDRTMPRIDAAPCTLTVITCNDVVPRSASISLWFRLSCWRGGSSGSKHSSVGNRDRPFSSTLRCKCATPQLPSLRRFCAC